MFSLGLDVVCLVQKGALRRDWCGEGRLPEDKSTWSFLSWFWVCLSSLGRGFGHSKALLWFKAFWSHHTPAGRPWFLLDASTKWCEALRNINPEEVKIDPLEWWKLVAGYYRTRFCGVSSSRWSHFFWKCMSSHEFIHFILSNPLNRISKAEWVRVSVSPSCCIPGSLERVILQGGLGWPLSQEQTFQRTPAWAEPWGQWWCLNSFSRGAAALLRLSKTMY